VDKRQVICPQSRFVANAAAAGFSASPTAGFGPETQNSDEIPAPMPFRPRLIFDRSGAMIKKI
jgi:hypothetical protein